MKINNAESIEEEKPVTYSIEPHPDDFRTYSDSQLELRQEFIDQKLALARQDGDDLVINWYEIEMISLQAERARRNGVNSYNSFNSYTVAEKKPVLDPEALHGLAGEIVNAIDPYTEADPVAVLTNTLTAFGNVVGPIPYFRVENTRHHLNLFIVQTGDTAKGRKGTGWSTPRRMFKEVDREWIDTRVTGGLSSGEGLIFAVRDERIDKVPVKEHGRVVDYQEVISDHGVEDKRLLLVEEELSQALKVMSREGNILSAIIRQAWDGGNLNPLTKSNPIKATGAHISIIGHITKAELLRHLTATEQSNGFANRFCWFLVARSKCIPNPTGIPEETLSPLIEQLRDSTDFARKTGEIKRDKGAATIWEAVYPQLSEGKPGLMGAVISRAEAQVMRLACIYSLLDKSELVRVEHLRAALALWDYSEKSALAVFGELTGDPAVDKAKEALQANGTLTITELHGLFGRNVPKAEIERVVSVLLNQRIATIETVSDGNGRPATILKAATKETN
jgi:Protein of unknown function (DUF3987)